MKHFWSYVTILTIVFLAAMFFTRPPRAEQLIIRHDKGYGTGIIEAPMPRSGPLYMRVAPSAKVRHLNEPAGPNNCGPRQFEVLNPDPGQPSCVGG